MNNQLIKAALFILISLTVIACGPGGSSGLAGIGGSGYVSSGSVTGFGSVFVNGVEFETDSATFDVDGKSGTQEDLAIGMIVRVDGSINEDGTSGIATNISFDDELQGPVSALGAIGPDGVRRTITVLGITVVLDSSGTTFDISGDNNIPANTVFNFETIAFKNNVEISGFRDSNGDIQATRVELKDIVFDENSIVEVKGVITDLSGTDFNLAGLAGLKVDASEAALDDLPDGLLNEKLVEVEGTFDIASNTIKAISVEAEDNSVADTDEFELEGLISGYVDKDTIFNIGDIRVDASNATLEPASLILANDVRVEAEGAVVDGVLIATEIELEGGEIKVHASVTSVNAAENTFEVMPVSGQPVITVTVTTGTQLEDEVNEIEPFTLGDLVIGDFVEVQIFEDGDGGIIATEIDVKEPSDVVVRGYTSAADGDETGGTVTILGIIFDFDSATKFERDAAIEGDSDTPVTGPDIKTLIDSISATPQLVKIQIDKEADEIADEIELESP